MVTEARTPTVPLENLLLAFPWLCRWQTTFFLYVVLALGASLTTLMRSKLTDFDIFCQSFIHLWNRDILYIPYPTEQPSLFKYSPTFAFFMAPFWALPKWASLPFWDLLNALVPFIAVQRLALSPPAKTFILFFSAMELLGSMQTAESNGIVVGLMIGTFAAFEKGRPLIAALLVCLGFYIKIFGIIVVVFFVFYRNKRAFIGWCLIFAAALGILPIILTRIDGLSLQYASWLDLLNRDQIANNLSLMGFVDHWLHLNVSNLWFQIPGLLIFAAPLMRKAAWTDFNWRLRFLSSALVLVVVFNHRAETPTFTIAVFGAAIWGVVEPRSLLRSLLLIITLGVISLPSNNLVSILVPRASFGPLGFKPVPCFLLWVLDAWRLAFGTASGEDPPLAQSDSPD